MDVIKSSGHLSANPDNSLGFGIPSYFDAVQRQLKLGDLLSTEVNLYPNPVKGNHLHIGLDKENDWKGLKLYLMDLKGNVMQRKKVKRDNQIQVDFDVSALPSGLFIMRLVQSGESKRIRFIKE